MKRNINWPHLHGPRGAAILGFAIASFGFGLSYVGPFAVPAIRGLDAISVILPLSIWGVLWIVNGAFLLTTAFKADQAKALGFTTGLFVVWMLNYTYAAVSQFWQTGRTYYWITALLFGGIVVSLQGMARMVNPAPIHMEVVELAGPAPEPEGDSGD